MAFEKPLLVHSFTAASDMNASTQQYIFVKFAAASENVLPCTAVADLPIGVLQNLPRQGEQAEVMILGISKVRVDSTDITDVSATSGLLGVSTSGRAKVIGAPGVGAETTQYVLGRVLSVDATDNDGALTTALINCINLGRSV
jgi:hypothetical protein